MRMLVPAGEKASGDFLIQQGRLVELMSKESSSITPGIWLIGEAPRQVIPRLVAFTNTPHYQEAEEMKED
jgi:hypothetical protein